MKSIKISKKIYIKLIKLSGQLQNKNNKKTTINDTITYLLEAEKNAH